MTQAWLKRWTCTLILLGAASFAGAEELRVYAYLTPSFLGPVLEAFEAETGISVSAEYMRADDLRDRLVEESSKPQADLAFTMEAKRLAALVASDVLIATESPILEAAIPSQHRHPKGLWYGLSKWTRTIFYAKDRVDPSSIRQYADLADEQWRGRICVRTANKIYVQSLLATMIAHLGAEDTLKFARGLVANFAREPIDLDLEQIKGVANGACDIALANSYYYARMQPLSYDVISGTYSDAKRILDAVAIHYPDAEGPGVHVNISGFGMVRGAPNPQAAKRLMEFLVRPSNQRLYADASKDYPIIAMKPHAILQALGAFKEDKLPLHLLSDHYGEAESLSRASGWLWK